MQMSYFLRFRLAFQNLLQTHQASRNYQRLVLAMIKHCLGNSQISSIPAWSKELFYITFLYRTLAKVYALAQADIIIHSQREIKKISTLKLTLSLTRSIKVHRRALVPYSLPSLWKNAQENLAILNSWSRNVTTSARETTTRALIYDVRMAQFVLKIEKLSHIISLRGSQDLRYGSLYFIVNPWKVLDCLKNKFGPWKVLEKKVQFLYEPCQTQLRKLQHRNRKLRIPGIYQLKVDWGKLTALTILWSWRYPLSQQSGEYCVCVCSYGGARVDEEIWPFFMCHKYVCWKAKTCQLSCDK